MPLTVQIDFDARDLGHAPIVGHRARADEPARPVVGKLASSVR